MGVFAKVWGDGSDENPQIVAILQRGEEGPEVRVFHEPPDFGVCSIAWQWEDDEDGWNQAEAIFRDLIEETARGLVLSSPAYALAADSGSPADD